ncbi:transcription activator of gluconeogenesis [Byssothecium circinans]|uniref:Transcription activator of gluconeogenesis n=1 Tax=Byssothecium circinans TaxID=147558 RepID=A0A6A5TP72_9PLEO|nr:transcription activator of gluconeogenesis [Byssothecium circinans]
MSTPTRDDASPTPEYARDPDEEIDLDPDDADMAVDQKSEPHSGATSPETKKHASNAKDPARPRRKKARRACFSCQRAHLTCGDERPCLRCIKRNLQDTCMDGIRKKAKYLQDTPDGALMPGINGHYPHMHGGRPVPHPVQDPGAVPVAQQGYYTQAPPTTYYPSNPVMEPTAPIRDAAYNNSSAPISPQYSQNQAPLVNAPATQAPQSQLPQFGGPLFDPSDPALFNFDISSLNFGNHYGALELGMLGHMSSGVVEAPTNDNTMGQSAGMYNPQMPASYGEHQNIPPQMSFGPDALPPDWQNRHSRHGSLQMQTPNNTPVTMNLDQGGHRQDSLNGPYAYAIGQGPPSLASASPASTDVHSGYDNDNPMSASTLFANANQAHNQRSPVHNRPPHNAHMGGGPLQPVQSNNRIRNRHADALSVYQRVTRPYNYIAGFHRLFTILNKKFSGQYLDRAKSAMTIFRPILLSNAVHLTNEDLLHAEKSLQRLLVTMHDSFAEVGTPCLICRRTGEIVGMNKEFEILTGWRREVLLGHVPNLNANFGPITKSPEDSERGNQINTTPPLPGQDPDNGPHAVNILEVMDELSALQYLEDFADLAYDDVLGKGHRRVNMLRYLTKEEMAKPVQQHVKREPRIKNEHGSIYQGEAAMRRNLGTNGLIDAMIMWHIKRDTLDMPMLVTMQIMPMLKP